jgi:hypothetical protein
MTRNDIRDKENLNPLPEDQHGDETFVPLNMIPASAAVSNASEPAPSPPAPGGPAVEGEAQRALPRPDDTTLDGADGRQHSSAAPSPPNDNVETLRAQRLDLLRRRLVTVYHGLFVDAIGRLLRSEAAQIGAAARRLLDAREGLAPEEDSVERFRAWLWRFREKGMVDAERRLLPLYDSLARQIATLAEEWQAALQSQPGAVVPQPDRWARERCHDWACWHIAKQGDRLLQALAEADPGAAIVTELNAWGAELAVQIADAEVPRATHNLMADAGLVGAMPEE